MDEGNDAKMRLAALGRCVISRGQISELDGYLAEQIEEEREAEEHRLAAAAERLTRQHSWMTEKEWLLRLDSGGSMLSFADNAIQEAPEDEGEGGSAESGEGKPGSDGTAPASSKQPAKKVKKP